MRRRCLSVPVSGGAWWLGVRRWLVCWLGVVVLAGGGVGVGVASAAEPWWHLTSGARPGHLTPGAAVGVDAEYEVTCKAGELVILVAQSYPRSGGGGFLCSLSHEELQKKFEEPSEEEGGEGFGLGVGNVEVPSGDGSSGAPFRVVFKGALEFQPVQLGTFTTSSATVTEKAKGSYQGAELVLTAGNVGDEAVNGEAETVRLTDKLPAHLRPLFIEGNAFSAEESLAPVHCVLSDLTCEYDSALLPFHQVEVTIPVEVLPGASSGEVNEVSVSGGGAPSQVIGRAIPVGGQPTPFGVESYELSPEEEGGGVVTQAGKHPFQVTGTVTVNQLAPTLVAATEPSDPQHEQVSPPALAKDLAALLPPGLVGNPNAFVKCAPAQFFAEQCPPASVVGAVMVTANEPNLFHGVTTFTAPIVVMEPAHGQIARFGFLLPVTPVYLEASVRSGQDYGVVVGGSDISQTAALLSFKLTFWGVPGAPAHDSTRGTSCLGGKTCVPLEESEPPPFLIMPTQCQRRLSTSIEGDSWLEPKPAGERAVFAETQTASLPTLDGCNKLPFEPSIRVTPDGEQASRPTGLKVDVHVNQEGVLDSSSLAESDVRNITVALPEGVALNTSAANGLEACAEGLVGYEAGQSSPPELRFTPRIPGGFGSSEALEAGKNFCPDASKVATVTIHSPLLPNAVEGSVYLADQNSNPFGSLVGLYIVAEDPVSGFVFKSAGEVKLNQTTGQIVSSFQDNPQLAFEDAELHFFGGERAPLVTPAHCGSYTTAASFVPWAEEPSDQGSLTVSSSSTFTITSGPAGSACPAQGSLPFSASLTGGMTNIQAGALSPLTTTITREDGQQQIGQVKLHMPPGLSGLLSGVKLCGENEANEGTCGPESLIGETIVSVGLGGDPFSVTGGKVYITGPYHGAPFGLSIVNPAVAGPYNLGKVIVRAKIEVDRRTAQLTITTNAPGEGYEIPHILDGIPLQIKHVNVTINRPAFTFNSTSCEPMQIGGAITANEGASSPVQTPFQVTNCANLKFAPKFHVSTSGKTSKTDGASLHVKLSYPPYTPGVYANIAKVKVDLPKQLPSRLTTLQKACLAAVYEANPAKCPPHSIIGQATVTTPLLPVPLTGPAYFVSHGNEAFPSLTILLQGYGVTVELVGSTLIHDGITSTTFHATPDVPFNTFELTLPQGPYSALAANTNLCKTKTPLAMPTAFTAQDSQTIHQTTHIIVTNCPKPNTKTKKTRHNTQHK